MKILGLLLTALSIREWQVAYASSGEIAMKGSFAKANEPVCQAFEDERRAKLELDSNTMAATTSKIRPILGYNMGGEWLRRRVEANRKLLLEAVKINSDALHFVSPKLLADREVVLAAVGSFGHQLCLPLRTELKADRQVVLAAVRSEVAALDCASKELQADRQVALAVVKHFAGLRALHSVSPELAADREVVLEAVKHDGEALGDASAEFRNDQAIVLEAVKWQKRVLRLASAELKANRQVVLEAVKHDGLALEWASSELKADRGVVLEAVKESGMALEHASEKLRSDRSIVLEAVKQDALAFGKASMELRAERQIVLEAVKQARGRYSYRWTFGLVSEELRGDREIVLEAVKHDGRALGWASKELRCDREIVLEAVKHDGFALQYASTELKSDRQIVLEAIQTYGQALNYASWDLQKDRHLMLEAAKRDGRVLLTCNTSSEFLDDREIVVQAMAHDTSGQILSRVSEKFRGDRELVLHALNMSDLGHASHVLKYASRNLTEDQDFLLDAVRLKPTLVTSWQQDGLDIALQKDLLLFMRGRKVRQVAITAAETYYECNELMSEHLGFDLWIDREIVMELAKNEVCYLPFPVLGYRCDAEIADLAMKKDGLFLEDACAELRANRSLVLTAVEENADALHYASQSLQGDWELIALAAAQGKARQFCNATIELHGERAHALRALEMDGTLLQCASPEFKANKELVLAAVKQSGCALEFSPQQWRTDPDIVRQALVHNGLALTYASEQLQCDSDMQNMALRSFGSDWLRPKILNDTTGSAQLSTVFKECTKFGPEEEVPNQTASFVAGGIKPGCLAAIWPIFADVPVPCEKAPFKAVARPSRSFVPIVLCVVMACALLFVLLFAATRRVDMQRLIQLWWSKDARKQCHGVDLEGLVNRRSRANSLEAVYHLDNTKPS